jgi:hypothetical protein
LFCSGGAAEAVEYPFEDTAVFAVARPHEVALFVTAEPVDEEDLRNLLLPFTALEQCQFLTNNT